MNDEQTIVLSKSVLDKMINVIISMPYAQVAQLVEEVKADLRKHPQPEMQAQESDEQAPAEGPTLLQKD